MKAYSAVQSQLESLFDGRFLKKDVPLSSLTSFQTGGPAAAVLETPDGQLIRRAAVFCRERSIPLVLLGRGTNVLAPDGGFAGLVIRMTGDGETVFRPLPGGGAAITCGAGRSLASLAKESVLKGYAGLEALSGIPGTLGGAIAMNAGAYGSEIKDILTTVTVLENGQCPDERTVPADRAAMGYRKSPYGAPECVVLSAELTLLPDDGFAAERMADYSRRRRERQPLSFPSAGSTFKRPAGAYAGALIERCGLKGFSVGGAQVSELHAGFLINRGGATSADILALISHVQETVLKETGYTLEREVRLLEELVWPGGEQQACIY